jgi:hypothetical protein
MLHRLPADVVKRVLMPLLDFECTKALERICKGVHQSMRASDPRAATGYDCFKMMHRDVTAAVLQQNLDVRQILYTHYSSCRFLHTNDRACEVGKAFNYMRFFCRLYMRGARVGCNDAQTVAGFYRWLGIEVPPDLCAAFLLP